MNYKNATHATIFKTYLVAAPYKYSNRFLAAAFLLSANPDTWKRAKKAIIEKKIHFDQIDRRGLSCYGYALLTMAKDIYENSTHINLFDLADPYLISDKTLELVFSTIEIARSGYPATGIKRESY